MRKLLQITIVVIMVLLLTSSSILARGGTQGGQKEASGQEEVILQLMEEMNEDLAALGVPYRINEVSSYVIPGARAQQVRILQLNDRWVPNDSRRDADGHNLTYLVDLSDGTTTSGLTSAQTEGAIEAAMTTWGGARCSKFNLIKRIDGGSDPDVFDWLVGYGDLGYPYFADITHAGWLPEEFFDLVFGPGGGTSVLGFAIGFIFIDGGIPTDINNDQYMDTALIEIYYNDYFTWGINNVPTPSYDVETVALHESGHGFRLGHFRNPPTAIMNPVYAGIRQSLHPTDQAAICTLYGSWPNR